MSKGKGIPRHMYIFSECVCFIITSVNRRCMQNRIVRPTIAFVRRNLYKYMLHRIFALLSLVSDCC